MKTEISNSVESKGLFHKMGSALPFVSSIQRKVAKIRKKPIKQDEFSSMLCPITGSLNRIGLRKYFDQIAPSSLTDTSLILLNVDILGKTLSDKTLQKFVNDIIGLCGSTELIARWSLKEFLLVCPETSLNEADQLANKICKAIAEKTWQYGKFISCKARSSQVNSQDLHEIISNIKTR